MAGQVALEAACRLRFGPDTALFGTAVLFGLYHGFVLALPVFVVVGLALG